MYVPNLSIPASILLENLYESEVIQKEKTKESVRQQVSDLLRKMHQEQKEKMGMRKSKSLNNFDEKNQDQEDEIIDKCIHIGLSFVELWVDMNDNRPLNHSETNSRVCKIISKAKSLGRVPNIVANSIAQHIQFLLEENYECN